MWWLTGEPYQQLWTFTFEPLTIIVLNMSTAHMYTTLSRSGNILKDSIIFGGDLRPPSDFLFGQWKYTSFGHYCCTDLSHQAALRQWFRHLSSLSPDPPACEHVMPAWPKSAILTMATGCLCCHVEGPQTGARASRSNWLYFSLSERWNRWHVEMIVWLWLFMSLTVLHQ